MRARRHSLAAAVSLSMALSGGIAAAQQNLGFELDRALDAEGPAGWRGVEDEAAIELDEQVAHSGQRSLRIAAGSANGSFRITQDIPASAISGNRIRLSAYLRSENVTSGSGGLWLRLDGPTGLLYIDGMRERDLRGSQSWTRYELEAPLIPEATRITFGARLNGGGTLWLDDFAIEGFDTSSLPPPSPQARRYVTEALRIMQQHSINRELLDWPEVASATMQQARGATTTEDAHLAVRYALARLRDGHSYLMTPRQSAALSTAPVSNARTGRRALEPRGEMLDEHIGYLWVPGFAGGTPVSQVQFADGLHELIAHLDAAGACAWVVDLRDNTGGNLWPMLAGLGPLLGDGEVGASVYPDGRRVPLSYHEGQARFGDYTQLRVSREPHRLSSSAPATAVLIGSSTASSGEVILTALRSRPNVRTFGTETRGLSTGNRTFALSDGASIVLTVAATSDRMGHVHLGPIAPDEPVARARGAQPLREQANVQAAVRWLQTQPLCGHEQHVKPAAAPHPAAARAEQQKEELSRARRAAPESSAGTAVR